LCDFAVLITKSPSSDLHIVSAIGDTTGLWLFAARSKPAASRERVHRNDTRVATE